MANCLSIDSKDSVYTVHEYFVIMFTKMFVCYIVCKKVYPFFIPTFISAKQHYIATLVVNQYDILKVTLPNCRKLCITYYLYHHDNMSTQDAYQITSCLITSFI